MEPLPPQPPYPPDTDTGLDKLELLYLQKHGANLKIVYNINASAIFYSNSSSVMGKEYVLSGAAVFQVKIVVTQAQSEYFGNAESKSLILIKFVKVNVNDITSYTLVLNSMELNVTNQVFHSDFGTWHLIYEGFDILSFDLNATLKTMASLTPLAGIHNDTNLTDFELRAEDGSVQFHRAVLAASSPVFKTMLEGCWKETTEGHIEVPATSKKTLQHLKDYMYLNTIPEAELQPLILLASYFMMPILEQNCADLLVGKLNTANAYDMLEFAMINKATKLSLAILDSIQSGAINVAKVRKQCLKQGSANIGNAL